MRRMRVYELARELNMTNKALIDRIKKIESIEIRSHMSTLEEKEIEIIKHSILGKDSEEESQRVKPAVIRRRRRQSTGASKARDEKESLPETEKKPAEKEIKSPLKTKEPVKTENQAREEGKKKSEAARPAKKQARNKTPQAAKIIFRPPPVVEDDKKQDDGKTMHKPEEEKEEISTKEEVKLKPETEVKVEKELEENKREEEKLPLPPEEKKEDKKVLSEQKEEETAPGKKKKSSAARIIKRVDPSSLQTGRFERGQTKDLKESESSETEIFPIEDLADPEIKLSETPSSGSRKKRGKDSLSKDLAETKEEEKTFRGKKKGRKRAVVEGDFLYGRNRRSKKNKKQESHQKTQITTPKAIKRRIKVDETIVLAELAKRMGIKASLMIQQLMMMGVMATVNQTIDFETAVLVASEFGFEVERASFEEENIIKTHQDKPEELITRAPVVTVMGHVDHGKTSLLDAIRQTHVVTGEAGGITQHIGAYSVETEKGRITFLDTPGHEAFTAMRSRGAKVTDIVVLVVAADDGVMPQTIEAINHAKAAEVPIIVAVNKMDKPSAEPDKIKRELSEKGVIAEEWGGDTMFSYVSAKARTGIDELLELVLLQAEVLELKANPNKKAIAYVVEAKLDTGRGPVASVLIQEGTLASGDAVVCGIHHGRIRAMINDKGETIDEAGPSVPVEILGLSGVPEAGDELFVLKDEKDAKQISQHRSQKQRAKELAKTSRMSLEKLFEQMEEGEVKELNIILKADVQGSLEALKESLEKLSSEEVKIKLVHTATGTVTESDVSLAAVSNAIIIGFNVRPEAKVHELAREENVDMQFYNIIYDALKDIQNAMVGMMDSSYEEKVLGRAEVRQTFVIPKTGTIAGSFVSEGTIQRNQKVRLLRDGVVLYDGRLSSLKRFKDDAREVAKGYECGISIENYNDIKVGDVIESYEIIEIKPSIDQ